MDNKKLLGKRIKQIRNTRGYTQEQLSELINIETSSLSGIESGRFFPSLHVLNKIASVTNTELIEFFKFTTVDIPENIDEEIAKIVSQQNRTNKELIYKVIKTLFLNID